MAGLSPRICAALGAAALALQGSAVAAQHYQCSLPRSAPVPPVRAEAPPRVLPVTGYTLALSWSPEFCKPRKGQRAHARQCSGRDGMFGLIVHGLWPESGRSWPQWCPAQRAPQPREVAANLCISPSASLVARQWAKHGACMTRRPATYLKVTRILWQGLRIPDFDRVSREDDLTAGTIRTRFVDANPGWFAEAVGVKLNSRGWLQELRLCYDKRFMPTACDRARFGARDGAQAKIWRGL
ncbi:ribonuclease T2 family protein [Qipengyuania flava]|uniref:ribonuclease T2 family protein n=1 Tax=Qipengyuania flava TaxID=192812 RepID=UPI001C6295B0|nr:ribonuclease T [Qipengyuania flava]QYJ07369.1 ribonuclease T [Qipengyuania flava]